MGYQVRLGFRLADLEAYTVPKRCSSCFRKHAPYRRRLTAKHQVNRQQRIQWKIQLPLCETCHQMEEVLNDYRPSRHGPPQRALWNRRAVLALMVLSLAAIALLLLPVNLVPGLTGPIKSWLTAAVALAFGGVYFWNLRASQRSRLAVYQALAQKAGHELGDVQLQSGKHGLILIFDNEEFGRTFAESNRELVRTTE